MYRIYIDKSLYEQNLYANIIATNFITNLYTQPIQKKKIIISFSKKNLVQIKVDKKVPQMQQNC